MNPSPAQNSEKSENHPDISVIVPFYNEAESVASLLNEIVSALSGKIEYEIIAVDDGSEDNTAEVLKRMMSDIKSPLRIIHHYANYGQSTAIHTGIRYARASWVVTLDGDGQNNPQDIFKLIETRDGSSIPNLNLINGYRKKRQDNLVKIVSSRVANFVRGRLLRDMTPDTGCGLKLIHRETFLTLPFFDHMHRFIPALIRRSGGNILTVEVTHRPRKAGKSKYSIHNRLWVGIVDMLGVLWLIRRTRNPITKEVTRYDD